MCDKFIRTIDNNGHIYGIDGKTDINGTDNKYFKYFAFNEEAYRKLSSLYMKEYQEYSILYIPFTIPDNMRIKQFVNMINVILKNLCRDKFVFTFSIMNGVGFREDDDLMNSVYKIKFRDECLKYRGPIA